MTVRDSGVRDAGRVDPALRDHLLALALAQPPQAVAEAGALLASRPGVWLASVAQQALANVHRDRGDFTVAHRHYRAAAAAARASGDDDRVAEVQASTGAALVMAGRTAAGLARLREARRRAAAPSTAARVGYLLGATLLTLGRHGEAGRILEEVLGAFQDDREQLWLARTWLARSCSSCAAGATTAAVAQARSAHRAFLELGQHYEAAAALRSLGGILAAAGRVPEALAALDEAEAAFTHLGGVPVGVHQDRVAALFAARLLPEARQLALDVAAGDVPAPARAELLLVAAECAWALGDAAGAATSAGAAEAVFRAQSRGAWASRARVVALRAQALAAEYAAQVTPADGVVPDVMRVRVSPSDPGVSGLRTVLAAVRREARRLDAGGFAEGRQAHLLAGQLAVRWGDPRLALDEFAGATVPSARHSPFDRATGALAEALAARVRDDPRAVLRHCRRGLDALDEQRRDLGDPELAALATGHARELAELAVRVAARGSARSLLGWVERTRATTLGGAPTRPPQDEHLARLRAAARDAARRLTEATDEVVAARIARERDRLEDEARRRQRLVAGTRLRRPRGGRSIDDLVARVADEALVVLADVDGRLVGVRVQSGTVRRRDLGPALRAVREADFARFALRRAAYGRQTDVASVGRRLEDAVLGGWGADLPERVTVVPPAQLHTVPWAVLPALAERAFSVAPSARLWMQARARGPRTGPALFVGGPGLSTREQEVVQDARRYAAARVLTGARATVSGVVAALDGAGLAHVAAHGSFRADAPLFSAVWLHDGPAHLHDLERLARPPHTMILSACDVGDGRAVGADEGLGLVTGLLGLGCAGVLAAAVPVNDAATVTVMGALHGSLAAGASLARAAADARVAAAAHPQAAATAAAFTVWGA